MTSGTTGALPQRDGNGYAIMTRIPAGMKIPKNCHFCCEILIQRFFLDFLLQK